MTHSRSEELFSQAQKYIPGGVNSPVRSFRSVGGSPRFISRGKGSHVWDVDGNEFVDYLGSWGPLILGHAHPEVVEAVKAAADDGTSFGAPIPQEVDLAQRICRAFPSVEMVRLVNSGTEACMSAIRLARAYTGRDKIIKFSGCYHGHSDGLLVKAGSGALAQGVPTSAGVPGAYAGETLAADYNDVSSVERYFETYPGEVAGIIVEPVAGNMGVVPPQLGFLESPPRADSGKWGPAYSGRGHYRLSDRLRRGSGPLRSRGGYNLPGQDHRGRSPRGRLWRFAADNGDGSPPGTHVPGRDPLG